MLYSEDTLRYQTKDVNVSAEADFFSKSGSANFDRITKSEIESSNSSLSNLLNNKSGIYIRNYGGEGGIRSVSIRGNTASQTAIFYNGFKLNSAQNGMFDLSNFSLEFIDEININRSGNSVMSGGNSAGGSINIQNNADLGFASNISFGSFDSKSIAINYGDNFSDLFLELESNYRNSLGNFPYDQFNGENNVSVLRQNARAEKFNFSLKAEKQMGEILIRSEIGNWYNFREIPSPAISTSSFKSDSRLENITSYGLINIYYNNIDFGFQFKNDDMKYRDKISGEVNFGFPESNYFTDEYQFFSNYYTNIYQTNILVRFDGIYTNLIGNMADPNALGNYDRTQIGASLSTNSQILDIKNLILKLGGRLEYFSDLNNFISFNTGLNYRINDFIFDFNLSRNYRPPAFNEMYYLNFGNLDLKAETSYNTDLGITWNYGIFEIRSSIFYSDISDQIVAVPASPILWSAQNFDQTVNYGLENSIQLDWNIFNFIFNYTRQISIDPETEIQLPYQPEEVIYSAASLDYNDLKFTISSDYSSFRFILKNNTQNFLESYLLINMNIEFELNKNFHLLFFANNIFNQSYEIINNFPMPGINIEIKVQVRL